MTDGWRCPTCGRTYAPWVAECFTDHSVVATTTVKIGTCTCYNSSTSGPCPLHPQTISQGSAP